MLLYSKLNLGIFTLFLQPTNGRQFVVAFDSETCVGDRDHSADECVAHGDGRAHDHRRCVVDAKNHLQNTAG